jgi:DDE superfamily endonuclease
VSLTLARGEVPVMVALRLFLPESWISDRKRLERAGVPAEYHTARTKPEIALAEIDRMIGATSLMAPDLTRAARNSPMTLEIARGNPGASETGS